MFPYPNIDPVAVSIGPFKVHWYGVMYFLAFVLAWLLGRRRIRLSASVLSAKEFDDLLVWLFFGLIIGSRLGYALFYNLHYYMNNPLLLFAFWQGGMSFHGGLIGTFLAALFYAKSNNKPLLGLTDFIAQLAPLGLGAGRIGNFINGELWGRPSSLPWAMIFPDTGSLPRHPSQLYEALFEGGLLFLILWTFSKRNPPQKSVSGLFLLGYGCIRFVLEFFRAPDPQLGLIGFGWLSMGQLLSLPMIVLGVFLLFLAYKHRKRAS